MAISESDWMDSLNMDTLRRSLPFAGATLILIGLARRTPLSVLLAAVGGGLVYEGFRTRNANYNNLYEKGMPTQLTIPYGHGIRIEEEVTIKRSPEDLYRFWRNFENLPRVMRYLDSVTVITPSRSHWVAAAPAGMTVAWDAEIIAEVENSSIGWRSVEGAIVPNAGSVRFAPAPSGLGTVVNVNLKYDPPGGPIGDAVAKLFGTAPSTTVAEDLRRFKAMMEMGEPVLSA